MQSHSTFYSSRELSRASTSLARRSSCIVCGASCRSYLRRGSFPQLRVHRHKFATVRAASTTIAPEHTREKEELDLRSASVLKERKAAVALASVIQRDSGKDSSPVAQRTGYIEAEEETSPSAQAQPNVTHPSTRVADGTGVASASVSGGQPAELSATGTAETSRTTREGKQETKWALLGLDEKEKERRRSISAANKGRRPWNYGRKHSEETKKKITERTRLAMQRPDVQQKLKLNATHVSHSEETKMKIRESLQNYRQMEKQVVQDLVAKETAESLAATLNLLENSNKGLDQLSPRLLEGLGRLDPKAVDKDSLSQSSSSQQLVRHFPLERIQRILGAAKAVFEQSTESDSSGEEEGQGDAYLERKLSGGSAAALLVGPEEAGTASTTTEIPEEGQDTRKRERDAQHKANIAASIRRKWEDPEYRARVISGFQQRTASKQDTSEAPRRKHAPSQAKAKAPKEVKSKATKKKKPAAKQVSVSTQLTAAQAQSSTAEQLMKQQVREAKLRLAKKLVVEMETALSHFSDQELSEQNIETQQSVKEAWELLHRAKSQGQKLTRRSQPDLLATQDSKQETAPGIMHQEDLDSALLVLNLE